MGDVEDVKADFKVVEYLIRYHGSDEGCEFR